MDWTGGPTRKKLDALCSRLESRDVKSLPLLYLIRNFQLKLAVAVAKCDRPVTYSKFTIYETNIRNVMLKCRLLISTSDLKSNKKRIRQAFGRLCATYINFVLKFFGIENTSVNEYMRVADEMYNFIKSMSSPGKGATAKRPLNFMNILLSSNELLKSYEKYRTAYYLMQLVLKRRDFCSTNPEAYLKFLALVSIFQNFNPKNSEVKNYLDDSKYNPLPSMENMSKFLRNYDITKPLTSKQLLQNLNTSELINSSKLALLSKKIPKAKIVRIKKYLKKVSKTASLVSGSPTNDLPAGYKNGRKDSYTYELDEYDPWVLHSETIDEIMTNASPEQALDDCVSDEAANEDQDESSNASEKSPITITISSEDEECHQDRQYTSENGNEKLDILQTGTTTNGSESSQTSGVGSRETSSFDSDSVPSSRSVSTGSDESFVTAVTSLSPPQKFPAVPAGTSGNLQVEPHKPSRSSTRRSVSSNDSMEYACSDASTVSFSGLDTETEDVLTMEIDD